MWRILAVVMDILERYRCEYTREKTRIAIVCKDRASGEVMVTAEIDLRDPILLRTLDSVFKS